VHALYFYVSAGLNGKCATIKRWEKLPDGKFGPIQVHGGVRLNDVVLRVNDVDLTTLPFAQVPAVHTFSVQEEIFRLIGFDEGTRIGFAALCRRSVRILPPSFSRPKANSFSLALSRSPIPSS